jgi:hypothetical protein
VLRGASNHEIAGCLGFNDAVDEDRPRDLVVSAGPARRSAAVHAASEVLDVLVVASTAPDGQAESTPASRALSAFARASRGKGSRRAYMQAQTFGAQVMIAASLVHQTLRTYAGSRRARPRRHPGRIRIRTRLPREPRYLQRGSARRPA